MGGIKFSKQERRLKSRQDKYAADNTKGSDEHVRKPGSMKK